MGLSLVKARLGVALVLVFLLLPAIVSAGTAPTDTATLLRELPFVRAPSTLMSPARPKGVVTGFIDFTPLGTQPGLLHPLDSSRDCRSCHGGAPFDPNPPRNGWMGSMMANAGRDPLFWAALDVANRDGEENGAPGIGDYCLRCHAPKAWYGGRVRKVQDVTPVNGEVDDALVVDGTDGCLMQGNPGIEDSMFDHFGGVGCHDCHRQMPQGPGGESALIANADVWLDDTDCEGEGEPCRYGPYRYPHPLPGGDEYSGPPHAARHSTYISDSAMCGSCHDVTSPPAANGVAFRTLIVDDGSMAGDHTGIAFPAERTYSEWQASDHAIVLFRDGLEEGGAAIAGQRLARGETCQSCHMPQAEPSFEGEELFACTAGGPPRNGNLPIHEFVGGNTWIPAILKGEYPNLPANEAAFDLTVAAAKTMLSERSALISTTAVLGAGGTSINASVRVTNLGGHKLPSGYAEGRRAWIQLEARDASNQLLWSNGAWDPATGALSVDAQTKIYEIKQGIWNATTGECVTTDAQGRERFHFVLNDCIAKDNRIPPLGFRGGADPEMAAYGYSYPATAPGSGRSVNFDVTSYSIPLAGGTQFPVSVTATLRYQVSSREYIEFLRNQAVERNFPSENALCAGGPGRPFTVGPQARSRGQYVYDLWSSSSYGRSPPVNMASGQATVAP
jgi:hypothetical protein